MTRTTQSKSSSIFSFEGKRYEFNSLEKKTRQLVNAIQIADAQIRREKDTLKILRIAHEAMKRQLGKKLKALNPINEK